MIDSRTLRWRKTSRRQASEHRLPGITQRKCLVGEICGAPIRSNRGRKFGSRSPGTDAGQRGFNSLLLAASCLSNLFILSSQRYAVRENLPVESPDHMIAVRSSNHQR
jgi:hypothetical protein